MNIPKLIHLIWLGGEKPKKFDFLIDTIKKINSDYKIIEWNDYNINFELINQDLFNKTENYGAKSDILRFEILYKFGGIYLDYDFLQIKNFDDLLDNDFFAGTNNSQPQEVWNSILGSTKENEICLCFLESLQNIKVPIKKNEINRVMYETGPFKLQKIIKNNNFNCKYKILIGDYFYPFPATERFKIKNLSADDIEYVKNFSKENTYCIHLHTTTWQ